MLTQRLRVYSQELYREPKKTPFWEEKNLVTPLQQANNLKTENQERILYEQPREECQRRGSIGDNIELVIILAEQNEELQKKIAEVMAQIEAQESKSIASEQKMRQNNKQIQSLRETLQTVRSEKKEHFKLETLNESAIPNQSAQLNSTCNNQSWLNEFLCKEDLQQLWTHRREQAIKNVQPAEKTVKRFTLDLNAAVQQQRKKKQLQKNSLSSSLRPQSSQRLLKKGDRSDRSKKTINSVAYKAREVEKRLDLKVDLKERQKNMAELWEKTRSKPLSVLRNAKKARNPEV